MPKFLVECWAKTWLTAEVEAVSEDEALMIAIEKDERGEIDWHPETDWDSSRDFAIVEQRKDV